MKALCCSALTCRDIPGSTNVAIWGPSPCRVGRRIWFSFCTRMSNFLFYSKRKNNPKIYSFVQRKGKKRILIFLCTCIEKKEKKIIFGVVKVKFCLFAVKDELHLLSEKTRFVIFCLF